MKYVNPAVHCIFSSLLLIVPTWLLYPSARAQVSSQEVSVSVGLCELLASPLKYSGAMVYVSGSVSSWMHGVRIADDGCPETLLIEWPDAVNPRPPFVAEQNDEYKKFESALYRNKPGSIEREVKILARIEGRFDYVLQRDKNGRYTRSANNGFGHLNASPTRLVIKAVSDVKVSAKSKRVTH